MMSNEQDNTTRLVRDEPRMDPKENEQSLAEIKDFGLSGFIKIL